MPSDAVVNLVVDATDAERSINVQLRQIVNDAERRAPEINLQVHIDNSVVNNITNGLTDVQRGARQADDDTSRLSATFASMGRVSLTAITSAARIGLIGSLAAGALPAVGALVTSLASLAPAATAGVTAFVAMKAATATLKVGLLGVSDALDAVFDPKADPAAVEEALKNLSDNAQDFVRELQKMKPALDSLRLDIQDRLFRDLDDTLARTGKVVLPELRTAALSFAGTFNAMAKNAAGSAQQLAQDGTLGRALGSGTRAFRELQRVPAQVLTAILRLSAGGGPLLERLAKRISAVADSLTKRLDQAAKSGALEDAISGAADALAQLGRIGGNVFEIIGNVMSVASESGTSLFGTLEKVTDALADITAGETFRDTLSSLIGVGQTLVSNVLPLLGAAFEAIGPVIQALAPIVQDIIDSLGTELLALIPELTPVLQAVVDVFGALWEAVQPLLPVLTELIEAILPSLVPILEDVAAIITDLSPLIVALATGISAVIVPALMFFSLGLETVIDWLRKIIDWISDAAGAWFRLASETIRGVVMPAITALVALLQGDYSNAWSLAQKASATWAVQTSSNVKGTLDSLQGFFHNAMIGIIAQSVAGFDRIRSAVVNGLANAVGEIAKFPSRARAAMGSLGDVLYASGRALVAGFIRGMVSQLGAVVDAASNIVSSVSDFFPHSPAKKGPFSGRGWVLYSGEKLVSDFARGIESRASRLNSTMWNLFRGPLISGSPVGGDLTVSSDARSFAGLSESAFSRTNPTVNVYLGNQLLSSHFQVLVDDSFETFNRTASQGVRV